MSSVGQLHSKTIGRPGLLGLWIFKSQPLFGRKVGKFSVAIEFDLLHVMTAFFDEKIGPLGESILIYEHEVFQKYLCPKR